jgi:hypothetical protein
MPSSLRFSPKNGVGGNDDGYCTGAALEVTVLLAESLRLPPSYSPLPRRLRPYVTVSSDAPGRCYSTAAVVVVPVGTEFLAGRADVHVSVLSEPSCRLVGATTLGWCAIPGSATRCAARGARGARKKPPSCTSPCGCSASQAAPVVVDAQQQQGWCRVAMGIPVSGASAAATVVGTPWPTWGAASR